MKDCSKAIRGATCVSKRLSALYKTLCAHSIFHHTSAFREPFMIVARATSLYTQRSCTRRFLNSVSISPAAWSLARWLSGRLAIQAECLHVRRVGFAPLSCSLALHYKRPQFLDVVRGPCSMVGKLEFEARLLQWIVVSSDPSEAEGGGVSWSEFWPRALGGHRSWPNP